MVGVKVYRESYYKVIIVNQSTVKEKNYKVNYYKVIDYKITNAL